MHTATKEYQNMDIKQIFDPWNAGKLEENEGLIRYNKWKYPNFIRPSVVKILKSQFFHVFYFSEEKFLFEC